MDLQMETCLGAQGQEEGFFFMLSYAKMDQGQLGCTWTVSKKPFTYQMSVKKQALVSAWH